MDPQPDRRRQGTVTDLAVDTLRKVKFWNVFDCDHCHKFWLGKDLHKNHDGAYACISCNHTVTDITKTANGQAFLQIVAPELGSNRKTTTCHPDSNPGRPVSA